MRQEQTVKNKPQHDLRQFTLTKNLINNLLQFNITPTSKLVLLYLSNCYNPKKVDIFPKQKTISLKLGLSERTVVRAINELLKAGLILKECKCSNRYKFTSRIIAQMPENEKNFRDEDLSVGICKNDISKCDNLAFHVHEQKREQKKNKTEREYLIKYAKEKNVQNIDSYVNAIIKTGNYQNIIFKYKEQEEIEKRAERRKENTRKNIEQYREDKKRACSPLDYSKEEAIQYIQSLPTFLRKTSISSQLIDKYSISV